MAVCLTLFLPMEERTHVTDQYQCIHIVKTFFDESLAFLFLYSADIEADFNFKVLELFEFKTNLLVHTL